MYEKSILKKTGQWWKLLVGLTGTLVSGAVLYVGVSGWIEMRDLDAWIIPMVMGSPFAGLAFFAFLCASVKCPKCGVRWFWKNASDKRAKDWMNHVLFRSTCPGCGEEFG